MISRPAQRAQSRIDLLKRVKRWTYGRKVQLCAGLRGNLVSVTEAILVHGLAQDEIGRWMQAYDKRDFEALRIGYGKKHRGREHSNLEMRQGARIILRSKED